MRVFIVTLLLSLFIHSSNAAIKTWDGGGVDNNWTTAANWDLDIAPVAGDALVFAGAIRTTTNNNFAPATSFVSITFSLGASAFSLSGNSVTLTGGVSAITASNTSLTMTINNNIFFTTSAPTITTTSGGTLNILGKISNGGFLITTNCDGALILIGVVSGTGGLVKNGNDTCSLAAINTYTGITTISAGTLNLSGVDGNVVGNIVNNAALTFSQTNNAAGATISVVISGTGSVSSTAANSVLSGNNTYSGVTTVISGKMNITHNNALGATSAGTVISDSATLIVGGTCTYAAEPLIINTAGVFRTSINNATDVGDYTGNIILNGLSTSFRGTETTDILTISGIISGTDNATFNNSGATGTVILSGANTYSGTTTLSGGTLQFGASGVIDDGSNFIANGGIFSTGSSVGYSETIGTLKLSANTEIALGTGSHNLNFAASNGTVWQAGKFLHITGWQGGFNCTSGTSGKIYTGSSAELSAGKLKQIYFTDPNSGVNHAACQLSNGEIVPSSLVLGDTSLAAIPNNCNTADTFDLNAYKGNASDGTWSIVNAPLGYTATIAGDGHTFNSNNTIAGTYTVRHTLSIVIPGGPTYSERSFTIYSPSTGGLVTADETVCSGSNSGTLNLTGNTGTVIGWESSTDNFLNLTPIANTTSSFVFNNITASTQYRAIVKSGNCPSDTSSPAMINVETYCDIILEWPNVMTPNGDGLNDVFQPKGTDDINLQKVIANIHFDSFSIYDRWGISMFNSQKNEIPNWNGKFYGISVSSGTYYFVVKYTDMIGKNHEAHGYITLM